MGEIFLNNVDFSKNQALNLLLQIIAGNHGSPIEGMIWYDSSAKAIKYRDDTATRILGVAGSGGDADTLDGNDSTFYLARANHTGSQLAATISDLAATVQAYRLDQFADPTASVDLNSQTIINLANGTASGDAVNKGQLDGAVSGLASTSYVTTAIANLVDSAPGTLDTLNELAAALGDDPDFATTLTTSIATKAKKFAASYGDGAATTIDVTHNFGSRDVAVEVYDNTTPWSRVSPGIRHHDTNTVRLVHSVAPTSNQYRVVCIGG